MSNGQVRRVILEPVRRSRRSLRRRFIGVTNGVLLAYHQRFRGGREAVDPALLESLRAEFGEAFGGYIDWRDEMYQITYDNMSGCGTRQPGSRYGTNRSAKQRTYFCVGRRCRDDLAGILALHGRRIEDISGLLEFASGYGRVTRFLVTTLDPKRIWVADVSADALEINSTCFGTTARLAQGRPEDFQCERQFEVVFAGMIFSHFSTDLWVSWLRRLYELVEPSGLLIFSTMGPELLPSDADSHLIDEDGFWFMPENETAGRLDVEGYGNTFVSEGWINKRIEEHGLGELLGRSANGLADWQDLYVIRKPAENEPGVKSTGAPPPRAASPGI
jgi:hypothetical protein